MSYVLNTSVAPFCHSQDHPGGVAVPTRGIVTGFAPKGSFSESECLLGSRETLRTRHRRIGGSNQHHLPASPRGVGNQRTFGRTNSRVSGLSGHRGLGEEGRVEIFHRDQAVVIGDFLRPHPGVMLRLPGSLLVQFRRLPTGTLVAVRLFASLAAATRHLPLCFRKLGGTPLPVPQVGQIMLLIGGGGGGGHTPVDTDTRIGFRCLFLFAASDKQGVPMPQTVLVNTHTFGWGRKFPRPHHRDGHTLGEFQSPISKRKSSGGVLQRRQGAFLRLERWSTTALHSEGMLQRLCVVAQDRLLGDLRAFPHPGVVLAQLGQQLAQPCQGRLVADFPLMDGFVPQESAASPFVEEGALRVCAGAQTVGVAHDLFHTHNDRYPRCVVSEWRAGSSRSHREGRRQTRTHHRRAGHHTRSRRLTG